MEVASQDLVQPFDDFGSRKPEDYQPFADLPIHLFDLLVELLLAGFPFHSELTVPAMGAVVCESKKSESFRFSFSATIPIAFGKSSEFDQPAFLLFQG